MDSALKISMKSLLILWLMIVAHLGDAQSSVLSSGSWYKIGITTTGVYKIDRNTLDVLGVGKTINPNKIKLYGNGIKGVLPQTNADDRPEDLLENAVYVSGAGDNSFDDGDYLLFYGIGPDQAEWTPSGFVYEKNIYSDTAYYFLQIGGQNGKRIGTRASAEGSPSATITQYDDMITYEEDEINLISSGRGWYGETINSGDSKNFSFALNGITTSIDIELNVVNQSNQNAEFRVIANGNETGVIPIASVPDGPGTTYSIKAREERASFIIPKVADLDLEVQFNGNASGERGYLDYFFMTFQSNLRRSGDETDFRWSSNPGELLRYEVNNATNSTIWNVTDPTNVIEQDFDLSGSKAIFQSQSSAVEEFVILSGSAFPTPFSFGSVETQNLRGAVGLDALIVAHPLFLSQAKQLAQFHRNHDGLQVKVATTWQAYNEFSSGRQDVSGIRDYAKHVYDEGGQLKYLLLFGDGSYDYKDRISGNSNFVPTYESRESFDPIYSYSSDDFYGFFDDDEGEWQESLAGDHTLEIGVGRLPAKSQEEAQVMVDKIIEYSTSADGLGKWRTEVTYVADDGDGNTHARHAEELSELIDTTYAQYAINKVLLDAFDQEATGSSEKSPQAAAELKTRIKNGTFFVNYIGHGNTRLWMEEEILTKADIAELTNRDKLPIFVTATCEFGRYDDPLRVSGAEDLLLLSQGGAIALLTTSRPVFASTNFSLNQAFHESIFKTMDGKNLRLGDVIRLTKNDGLAGQVNRNFTLLGDPMMMPAYPSQAIVLDDGGVALDTLSALEKVTFSGEVQLNGARVEEFQGKLSVVVHDVKQSFRTKGQESQPFTYELRNNALFRGEASVVDGRFSFTFVVPKNISYQNMRGKMSLYAWDEVGNRDAGGASRAFVIGGTNPDPATDDDAPSITVYMNDSSFVDGGLVGRSPLLIASIEDESGITTTRSGVVQGITLTLMGETINLNDFYTAALDDYTKGTLVYPLQDLEPGNYSGILKVWDTHNNASERVINFKVSNDPILLVYNPIVYPNPVYKETTIAFEHDREDENLFVSFFVYSAKGEIVKRNEWLLENSERRVEIDWEPRSSGGEKLKPGIYYSKIIIQSQLDGAAKEINKKLVIVD